MSLEFLTEMGWKSAVISGSALLVLILLRSRSPADRAAVLRLAVLLLLMLPLVSLLMPAIEIERPAPMLEAAPPARIIETGGGFDASADVAGGALAMQAKADAPIPTAALFLLAYLGGLAIVGTRLLAGLWTLRRWTKAADEIASPAWRAALGRAHYAAGLARPVRLLLSPKVPSPMSWGVRSPVILIGPEALERPEDADAIVAHEMAHIARGDWPALMLSRIAVALFWFNPLVWLVERSLIQHAEEAADLCAVDGVEPVQYAQSLVACVRCGGRTVIPANSMAPGNGLSRRVHAILDETLRRTPSGSVWTAIAMVASIGIAAPVSALKLVPAKPAVASLPDPAPPATTAPAPPAMPDLAPVAEAVQHAAEAAEAAPIVVRAAAAAVAAAHPHPSPAPAAPAGSVHANPAPAAPTRPPVPPLVDTETLAKLRVHGITAEYVREMKELGARFSADQLIEMQVHGISPPKVRQYGQLGYTNLTVRQLTNMAIHDVSPDFIRRLRDAGYRSVSPEQLVSMRIHGVSASAARRAAAARLSADQLIEQTILGED